MICFFFVYLAFLVGVLQLHLRNVFTSTRTLFLVLVYSFLNLSVQSTAQLLQLSPQDLVLLLYELVFLEEGFVVAVLGAGLLKLDVVQGNVDTFDRGSTLSHSLLI